MDIVHIIVCHAVDTQHLHANTHFLQPKKKIKKRERERELQELGKTWCFLHVYNQKCACVATTILNKLSFK